MKSHRQEIEESVDKIIAGLTTCLEYEGEAYGQCIASLMKACPMPPKVSKKCELPDCQAVYKAECAKIDTYLQTSSLLVGKNAIDKFAHWRQLRSSLLSDVSLALESFWGSEKIFDVKSEAQLALMPWLLSWEEEEHPWKKVLYEFGRPR